VSAPVDTKESAELTELTSCLYEARDRERRRKEALGLAIEAAHNEHSHVLAVVEAVDVWREAVREVARLQRSLDERLP